MTAQIVILLAIVIVATLTLTVGSLAIVDRINERRSGWAPAGKVLRPSSHQVTLSGNRSHYRYDSRSVAETFWDAFVELKDVADESAAIMTVSSIHSGMEVGESVLDGIDRDTMELVLDMLDDDWSAYYYGTLAIGAIIDEEEEHLASLADDPRLERRYAERESHYEEDYPETHLAKKRKAAKRWLSYDGRPMCNKKLLADLINC